MAVTYSVFASAIVVFASTIALPFFKSSAHMAGIAGFIALYVKLFDFYNQGSLLVVIALASCAGAVGWFLFRKNKFDFVWHLLIAVFQEAYLKEIFPVLR